MQAAGSAAFFLLAAGFGGLLRGVEQARSTAIKRGIELEAANQRLRVAIVTERELVPAQERARSAHELHDGLGHRLTRIGMSLQVAQLMRERDPERSWEEITRAEQTNQEALDVMRLWVRALHPPALVTGADDRPTFDAIAEAFSRHRPRGGGRAARQGG